jgi:hypothetical protein
MKRQLGPFLIVLALLCAPVAWSQTGSMDPSQNGSQVPSMDPSQNGSQPGSTDQSQSGSVDSSQSSSTQNGSSDSSQPPNPNLPQNGTSNASPTDSGDTSQQTTIGPQSTFTHPEQLPPLQLLNEVKANTGLQLMVSTGLSTDSNPGASMSTSWITLASFNGTLGIVQVRPKLTWSLYYGGGTNAQIAGGGSYYNTITQTGTANVLWQFARRWQLKLADSYYYSDDPFQPYLTITSVPAFNDPNPTVYIPQTTSQGNTGTVDLAYKIAAHDVLDFNGFENFLRYQQNALQELQNTFMYAGSMSYQHQFSARFAGGGGYEFSALDFGHGESRAGIQTFQGFISYTISPGMTLAAWVGPELTNTKDVVPYFCLPGYGCLYTVVHGSDFNVAEGFNFSWATPHNSFRAKFAHRVTNGGGLLGVVKLYLFTADYRRPLSQRWAFQSGLLYGNNVSISGFSQNEYLNSLTATAGLWRNINPAWAASISYSIIDQKQNNIPGYTIPHWIDNRIAISLQYNWGHSLGR